MYFGKQTLLWILDKLFSKHVLSQVLDLVYKEVVNESQTRLKLLKLYWKEHLLRSTVGLEINDINVSADIICKIIVKTLKRSPLPLKSHFIVAENDDFHFDRAACKHLSMLRRVRLRPYFPGCQLAFRCFLILLTTNRSYYSMKNLIKDTGWHDLSLIYVLGGTILKPKHLKWTIYCRLLKPQ